MIFAFLLLGSWSSLTGPKTAQEALTTSAQEAPRGTKKLLRGTSRVLRCLQEAPKKHPTLQKGGRRQRRSLKIRPPSPRGDGKSRVVKGERFQALEACLLYYFI